MSCERYLELLSARLDGALTQQEEKELMQHLQGCDACRAIARELEDIHSALAQAPQVQPPEELVRGVMERIGAQRAARRAGVRRFGTLAAAVVLCVGLYPVLESILPVGSTGGTMEAADAQAPMQPDSYAEQERADGALLDIASASKASGGESRNGAAVAEDTQGYSYAVEARPERLRLNHTDGGHGNRAWVVDSPQALEQVLAVLDGQGLAEVLGKYDADFFRTGRLLAVAVCEPSSSITHAIAGLDEVQVWVQRQIPQTGDSDVACWLILTEGDENFGPTRTLAVEWTGQ